MKAAPSAAPASQVQSALVELAACFGDRFSTSPAACQQHGHDESWHPASAPDGVVFAASTDDVVAAVKTCAAHAVPIIAFGAGSAMEGNVNAVAGGIAVDTTAMQAIVEVNAQDMDCTVEAGVTRSMLNHVLRDTGLFFPVDPGADATLGGMAATRASGTMTVRYGSMRDNVIGLEVVLADGTVTQVGGRARKSSSGYDLTRLFVGSEGTLGVITKVTLRLHPIPEHVLAATAVFPDFTTAIDLVAALMQFSLPVARAEFMDALAVEAVCRYLKLDYPRMPTLFFEFHGGQAELETARVALQDLCSEIGATSLSWASSAEQRARIWQARHMVAHAEPLLRPGAKALVTDVCVPLSRLAECIAQTKADLETTGLVAPMVGHVGDGNFHLALLIDPTVPAEIAAAEALHERLVMRALQMRGTSSGEHGIGLGKRQFLRPEHGAGADLMWRIKCAFDPAGLMNPHKIFDPSQFSI